MNSDQSIEQQIQRIRFYYETIIGGLPCYVYWKDKDFIYLGCNDLTAQLLHLPSRHSIVGKTDYDFGWEKEVVDSYRAIDIEIVEKGQAILNIEETVIIDGKSIYLLVNKEPLFNENNEIIGILGISIDITERKKMEADLRQAKIAAEAASRAKSEFIANMSHDLRTPLTGIIGMSQALENITTNPLEKEYAKLLNQSGEQLLALLNGVLDVISVDKVQEAEIHEETFHLRGSLDEIAELERPTVKIKGIDLTITIDKNVPDYLVGDRTKINRILLNLIGNAIKFTEAGSITVIVSLLQQKKEKVTLRFSVQDTGIGIPKEAQGKIFGRFYRVNPSHKGRYEGYGIGLHIAQRYTELLGSEIKLISEPGKGSVFYFDVSLKIGNASDVAASAQLPETKKEQINQPLPRVADDVKEACAAKSNSPHLLLVEDNQIALISLEAIVKQAGCKIHSAIDGEEAFRVVTVKEFDLIITDIGLPGMSGLELSQRIREWETMNGRNPVPIIALTGHAKKEITSEDSQSCINQIVEKPMRPDTLQAILNKFVSVDIEPPKSPEVTLPIASSELKLPELKAQLFEMKPFALFELSKALEAQAGNKGTLENQLNQLIALTVSYEEAIKQAVAAYNWKEAGNLALKIKDKAGSCGTIRLEYASYYVEHYCQESTYPSLLENLCDQLIKVMQETRQCLEEWFREGARFSLSLPNSSCNGLGRDLPDREEQLFELQQYPLLDVAKGMEIAAVSEEEMASLLQIIMEEGIPNDKMEIKQAYASGDWGQVEKIAHRAKGGTDYTGTIRLKYACMYLERYRKAGHVSLLDPLYQQLIEVFDATQLYIKEWLKLKN